MGFDILFYDHGDAVLGGGCDERDQIYISGFVIQRAIPMGRKKTWQPSLPADNKPERPGRGSDNKELTAWYAVSEDSYNRKRKIIKIQE